MSVYVTHSHGAIVVRACAANQDDCLGQLVSVLGNVLDAGDRVVLDLSDLPMVPTSRITSFFQQLDRLRVGSEQTMVVVMERATARRLLRAITPKPLVPVVASLDAALMAQPA